MTIIRRSKTLYSEKILGPDVIPFMLFFNKGFVDPSTFQYHYDID